MELLCEVRTGLGRELLASMRAATVLDAIAQKVLLPSGGRTSKALATEPMVL